MSYTFADGGELRCIHNPLDESLSSEQTQCFKQKVKIFVFFLCTDSLSPTELRCSGPDWYEFGDFCYKPFEDKKTWRDAQETCRSVGAELVSILSMTEQSWLESYLYMGMDLEKQEVKVSLLIKKVRK